MVHNRGLHVHYCIGIFVLDEERFSKDKDLLDLLVDNKVSLENNFKRFTVCVNNT